MDSFYYALLYTIRYQSKNKKKWVFKWWWVEKRSRKRLALWQIICSLGKLKLDLDIQNFENQCFSIKDLFLNKYGLFLRVYELKEKFWYLIKQDSKKKAVLRDLPSFIVEKFSGFYIVCIEFSKELRQSFRPIDIITSQWRKTDDIINCFYSKKLSTTFTGSFNEGTKIKHCLVWQCYFCSDYYATKDKFDCHFENCTGRTGYAYDFDTDCLLTFEKI